MLFVKVCFSNINNVGFLARDDIEQLLTVTLSNTYFTFESNIYCQVKGLPMGSSISGILAILFMDRLEKQALTLYQPQIVDPYKRYIDDAYLQTIDETHADKIHQTMNSLHPDIKFEIEKPSEQEGKRSISLLDFTVNISHQGETSFEFYRKKAKKPLFVNYKSALPRRAQIIGVRVTKLGGRTAVRPTSAERARLLGGLNAISCVLRVRFCA